MQPTIARVLRRGMLSVFLRRYWTVGTEKGDRFVVLTENNDNENRLLFPSIWLRDNCQCSQCFDAQSNSRIINLQLFNYKVRPTQTKITNNLKLQVDWSDDHKSEFPMEWLRERNFSSAAQKSYLERFCNFERKSWAKKNFFSILRKYEYRSILDNDNVLLDFLTSLTTFGVAIIENAGVQLGTLEIFAKRIAFLRRTQYGETFRVEAKADATNAAYKASTLQLHVDLPYNRYMPDTLGFFGGHGKKGHTTLLVAALKRSILEATSEIPLETIRRAIDEFPDRLNKLATQPILLFLHCIQQSKDKVGGESELTDCLHICQEIKKNQPVIYDRLKTIDVDWSDIGQDDGLHFHTIHREPVIRENKNGKIERINFSQPQRDTHFNVAAEQVDGWYEAWSVFVEEIYDPQNKVQFKLNEGDILVIDNSRMVHGRTGFGDSRLLEGGYMDWDLAYSKLRVLRKQLSP